MDNADIYARFYAKKSHNLILNTQGRREMKEQGPRQIKKRKAIKQKRLLFINLSIHSPSSLVKKEEQQQQQQIEYQIAFINALVYSGTTFSGPKGFIISR